MTTWDPARYLQFEDDRSRPFVDLVARVRSEPSTIVDLGCGPGHLTQVLRQRWPDATIHGVDSSPEMIRQAVDQNDDARATYELADVGGWEPAAEVDLVVSNALFQWVPDQLDVIGRIAQRIADGGTFALQVPRNYASPSHTLLRDIAAQTPFDTHTAGLTADRGTDPMRYLELFSGLGFEVDLWETEYVHLLEGDDPVFAWVSGTGARPYLQALPDDLRPAFEAAYRSALRDAYSQRSWGTAFPFRRTFVVARRTAALR